MEIAEIQGAIRSKQEYNRVLTEYTDKLRARANKEMTYRLARMRGYSKETIDECGIFYIGNMAEMVLPEYINILNNLGVISKTNGKPIFNERWVIPIKDVDGLVMNLVGYSGVAAERYVYGTSRYYRRRDTFYGLENLELAYKLGYAIITEGITDTIKIRELGYKNSFGRCGTHNSEFMKAQLSRCRHGVISLTDRDKPGRRSEQQWQFNRYALIHVPIKYKDCDEMLRESGNIGIFKECLDRTIAEIVSIEHRGGKFPLIHYTML